jgi:hypothetical protein
MFESVEQDHRFPWSRSNSNCWIVPREFSSELRVFPTFVSKTLTPRVVSVCLDTHNMLADAVNPLIFWLSGRDLVLLDLGHHLTNPPAAPKLVEHSAWQVSRQTHNQVAGLLDHLLFSSAS